MHAALLCTHQPTTDLLSEQQIYARRWLQVTADKYEAIDKELLQHVEEVLLNRRADATERMLQYAATLDPKSRPTALKKLAEQDAGPQLPPRVNYTPGEERIALPEPLPPVPEYAAWEDPIAKSPQFKQVALCSNSCGLSCSDDASHWQG